MNRISKLSLVTLIFSGLTVGAAGPVATSGQTGVPRLTDAQIAGVLEGANKAEAEAGQLALQKSTNAEVKGFAQMMVDDHRGALEATSKLMADSKVKVQHATTAVNLKSAGAMSKAKLEKLNGAAFDKAYIGGQIGMHKEVLKTIDTQLLPNVQSSELKALIQKMRPTIETHLNHAQGIQAKL